MRTVSSTLRSFALGPTLGLALLLPASPLLATCGGGGGGGIGGLPRGGNGPQLPSLQPEGQSAYQVPWQILLPSDPAPTGVLVLYWFPTSTREQLSSELQTSRSLTLAAAKCVVMAVASADHAAL